MLSIIKQAIKKAKGAAARTSGYDAEDAACAWLVTQGLKVIERNVRYTFGEIDIVAWHGDTLVLLEVRLRKNARFGDAAASITPRKQARLWAAGEAYAAQFKRPPPMRIDVLAYSGENTEPLWIKNALG
jgi:putative endonuclease